MRTGGDPCRIDRRGGKRIRFVQLGQQRFEFRGKERRGGGWAGKEEE